MEKDIKKYIGSKCIIEKKNKYLFPNAMHFYRNPPQIVKGDMQYLFDDRGNKYIDFFSGVSVVNCGHCNPFITEQTIKQTKKLQHTSIIYLTQPMARLAEKMAGILPGEINRTFFCNSGTEANEGAMLLARMHTRRKEFIAFEGGLHGRSYLTMSVTGIPMWRIDPYLDDGIHFAPNIYDGKNPLDVSSVKSLDKVKEIIKERKGKIAACIIETIQGNGGIITPPDWFFKELKDILAEDNILLIADEVQTGFARTGKMFAIQHYNVVPDIMTMAKALGNGIPIAAFSAGEAVAKSFNKPSASTLGGNPVSCAAALAVLDYIKENNLCERAEYLGEYLQEKLEGLKEKYEIIKDVRGRGLMLGMEITDIEGNPDPETVDGILEYMKDQGMIIGKNGLNRNVLAFQPPLVINETDIEEMTEKLDKVLRRLKETDDKSKICDL